MKNNEKGCSPDYIYCRLWFLIAALLLLSIIGGSLWPFPPQMVYSFQFSDKLFHMTAYFILMFWYIQLTYSYWPRIAWAAGFIALGVGLEFLQGLSGFRLFDWYDASANSLGVLLALMVGFTRAEGLLKKMDSYLFMNKKISRLKSVEKSANKL